MKNKFNTLPLLFALITTTSFSQLTITKADLLSGADTLRMSQASPLNLPDPKLTGGGYTWNYDSLKPILQFVDTFVAVSSTPFLYQLYFNNPLSPKYKASFAQKAPDINVLSQVQFSNTYNYFKNTTAEFSVVGFGSTINGTPLSIKYDSTDVIYKFPLNFGSEDSSISKYVISIPTLGYYGQRMKRVNKVEGWGTLRTPYGVFSVLKVKSTLYRTDTLFYSSLNIGATIPLPVQYEYKWLTTGKKLPVLQINVSNLGTITRVIYQDSMRAGVIHIGINQLASERKFEIFPNPTNDNISVRYTVNQLSAVKLDLVDVHGRLIGTLINQQQSTGTYSSVFNLNKLNIAKGIYFVKLNIADNLLIEKLIVQ